MTEPNREMDRWLMTNLAERLDRMEASIGDKVDKMEFRMTERLNNHAERIRAIELAKSWMMGVGAALGAAAGWLGAWLHSGGNQKT